MRVFIACAALAACNGALAQAVALQGMMGNRALLIIDGAAPRMLAPGESRDGVKVISTAGDQAVIEIEGRRHTLRVGDAPASVGGAKASSTGTRVVLPVGTGGHYFTEGTINGQAVSFLVDTGSTYIAMGTADATRLGLDYVKKGERGRMGTANGVVPVYRMKLNSVRIGDVELFGIDAVVTQTSMPYMLLGNSFLSRFQVTHGSGQMVLERRY